MKRVVFTGAGASAALQLKLTSQLMPAIVAVLKKYHQQQTKKDNTSVSRPTPTDARSLTYSFLEQVYPGIFRDDGLIPSITDVVSLIDFAIEGSGGLPLGSGTRLTIVRDYLVKRMSEAIIDDDLKPADKAYKSIMSKFVNFIRSTRTPTLISTNYDISVDRELLDELNIANDPSRLDLGFDWLDANHDDYELINRPKNPALRLYKLHGSFNMLRCPICGHTWFNYYGSIQHQTFSETPTDLNTCRCTKSVLLESNIVAMSYSRQIADPVIHQIWRAAYDALIEADEWCFIGYSIPPEDLGIRSLLVRSYYEKRTIHRQPPKVVVVQKGDESKAAYQTFFPDCTFFSGGLEAYLDNHPTPANALKKRTTGGKK
jgi:hypothetical protein